MINEAETPRRFRNLISTAQLVKMIKRYGYEGTYTEPAIYKLFEKYGLKYKAKRGGKAYFNRKNAVSCIERHIFELRQIAEELEQEQEFSDVSTDDNDEEVGYYRDDMSAASRELLAKDGVFGADENELYTNESVFSFRNIVNTLLRESDYYKKDILMQRSMENGGPDEIWENFLAEKNTFYGAIARLAKQNNHRYTDILRDLQNRVIEYTKEGRFGTNQDVVGTINKFCKLLAYINGAYEAAVNQLRNEMQIEPQPQEEISEGVFDYVRNARYKDVNRYGVRQKIGDDRTGEWMRQLQGELRQLLEWNYLHGAQTVEATKAFIEFLEVEKRGLNIAVPLNKMKMALVGVALLGNVLNVYAPNVQRSNFNPGQTTTQTQNQMSPQNIQFDVNSAELNQQSIEALQQMGQNGGSFDIVIHQSQNSSGVDSSYETQLMQQRAQNIKNALGQNVRVTVTRGNNTPTPYVEVMPG